MGCWNMRISQIVARNLSSNILTNLFIKKISANDILHFSPKLFLPSPSSFLVLCHVTCEQSDVCVSVCFFVTSGVAH